MVHRDPQHVQTDVVQLPSPTAWPMVLALGLALICAGLVTSVVIGMLGFVLFVWASVGWFMQVLPIEQHVEIPVRTEEVHIVSSRRLTDHLPTSDMHRKVLPIETFHISSI